MPSEKNLQLLIDHGSFSEIDIHFAKLMMRFSGQDIPELFLASALVSRATSEGHICLDLFSELGDDSKLWENLYSSNVVGKPGDYKPLILDDKSRLYLYRYWKYEKSLSDDINKRVTKVIEEIDIPLLKNGLSKLFPKSQDKETDWQKVAAFVSVMKRFCVISGGPGTGKSTVIAKILALILEQNNVRNIRITLAAPTGKAAARLQEAINKVKGMLPIEDHIKEAIVSEASTIHRLLGTIPGSPYFRHNAKNPLPAHIVVIDEASMVDLALMSKLVEAIPFSARLILLGDKDQLASVEAGSVLGDICDTGRIHGFSQEFSKKLNEIIGERIEKNLNSNNRPAIQDCVVQLNKSFRFGTDSGIGTVSQAVNKGDGTLALSILKNNDYDDIRWKDLPLSDNLHRVLRETVIQGFGPYLGATNPIEIFHLFERFRLLCAVRKGPYGVSALNLLAERILREENLITTEKRWYKGRPVLISKNDYNLKLFNGDIGIILPDQTSNDLRAFFLSPDGTLRRFLPIRLPEHETAYAMTVHKSQGSEFDETVLLLPDRYTPILTRELIYTGITRAKKSVEAWGIESVFLEAISKRTERTSGLRDALWRMN